VWEARTYTPQLYLGRPLHSAGSDVVFSAVPTIVNSAGSLIDKKDLIYEWYIKGSSQPVVQGIGKHTVVLSPRDVWFPVSAILLVRDQTGEVRAEKRVEAPLQDTEVLLYEDNPLRGIRYAKALTGVYDMQDVEVSLVVEPYHFSATGRSDERLQYEWTVDKEPYTARGGLVLRPEGGVTGQSTLNLNVVNTSHFLQRAGVSTQIKFGARSIWGVPNLEQTQEL